MFHQKRRPLGKGPSLGPLRVAKIRAFGKSARSRVSGNPCSGWVDMATLLFNLTPDDPQPGLKEGSQ